MMAKKFAFIVHPTDRSNFEQMMGRISHHGGKNDATPSVPLYPEGTCFKTPSLQFLFNGRIGLKVECLGIVCPLLPAQMVSDQGDAISRILEAISIAEDYGARLVGLGGFTSIIGSGGVEIARHSPLPVTSGNTCTVVAILDSLYRATKLLNLDLENSTVAIIGATGDIGSTCAKTLAGRCGSMIIVARNEERLNLLAEELRGICGHVEIERRQGRAARKADLVLTATSAHTTLIEASDFKQGAIVCDASYPANVSREVRKLRKDILVFEGGIVCWPGLFEQVSKDHPFWMFNPPVGAHGCFGETLLLALEEKFVTYTIGRGNITLSKLEEMRKLASKYGFLSSDFWYGDGSYNEEQIGLIREARLGVTSRSYLFMARDKKL